MEERELPICIDWLSKKNFTEKISKRITTRNIKHRIEKELKTYVSNEAVIAAVKQLNIPHLQDEIDPHTVYVGMAMIELNPNYRKKNPDW